MPHPPGDIHALAVFYDLISVEKSDPPTFLLPTERFSLALQDELEQLLGTAISLQCVPAEEFKQLKTSREDGPPMASKIGNSLPIQAVVTPPEAAPITLLDELLGDAVQCQAADIHFESFGSGGMGVRMRIDGELRPIRHLPQDIAIAIQTRLKLLAKLNTTERFRPQDGRFRRTIDSRPVDFRISTIPTKSGESIVLRLLDRQHLFPRLQNLELPAEIHTPLLELVRSHHGIFLVVGPTGSGKTTTLYAALREVNAPENKILTIEDPVEYESDGLIQVPVDLAIGRTFSRVLRAFLRHDPDKILVGEIRDGDTATVAIQAALTGHMVFSTLHTASPAEALLRLLDMGIDAFLLGSCLRGILNQRLVRLNCSHCSRPPDAIMIPEKLQSALTGSELQEGTGCEVCHGSGSRGRRAIFEYLPFGDLQRQLLLEGRFDSFQPFPSLASQGINLLRRGLLSPAEFLRHIPWQA